MKTWLITGVGKGLGKDLAEIVLQRGDRVVGTVRSGRDKQAFAASDPERAVPIFLDVTRFDDIVPSVNEIEDRFGRIDVLVNNAGTGLTGAIEETPLETIKDLFEVNVLGAVAMIQAVLPGMRRHRRGHIINITSVSGLAPWAGTGIYGASKYAMECIGQTLADEVQPLGVHVTNVAPGGMRTDFAGGSLKSVPPTISDYDGTAHLAREVLTGGKGKEPSSPQKIARAISEVVDMDVPPKLLLLGADAYKYAKGHLADLSDGIEAYKNVSLSVSADGM
ncbi:oxidoreductase [uncultured Hyphomonas sp.]|jgi:NAD(P)-dependent dehydrogenase (short-subunit alcohol dehydrogenase family)|uniref:oxidoreductase n=1 Tax=uncultured Hyphomonas sp. TaxID=225298 RepID=UPI000C354E10|nr:short-chain dehydrogenase/reductase [Hyphomonadaceae bacterium]|tara:strand:- start:96574 stop:97407 length:834 start_codon:yes stop_codon:yes gene_type:complete